METLHSFKGYGKVNETEDREFRRRTRRRLVTIAVASSVLLLILVAVIVGVVVSRKNSPSPPASGATADSIKAVCSVTLHPDSCYASISAASGGDTTDPEALFVLSLRVALGAVSKLSALPEKLAAGANDTRVKEALQICSDLFDDSIDTLNNTLASMEQPPPAGEKALSEAKITELRTWMSAVLTDMDTCLDGFENTTGGLAEAVEAAMRNSTELTSNSLAILTGIIGILDKLGVPLHRKLLSLSSSSSAVPEWVASDPARRRLLQRSGTLTPDVVVAKDGSGRFRTITEALALVPKKNGKPFVIYVKAGVYVEGVVVVDKGKWNVFMVGDGMDKTIVSGSKNFVDGTPTFKTASFVVEGKGFMARDMTFRNTAGPQKHQAVALRAKADFAVFYRCAFDGYQDTLYAHSLRQFYRECDIRGTVDFIFGNAAAVFQKCTIRPRQPMPNQQNTITAQGRTDPNQNTGISVHDCSISPFGKVTVPTFLGRPWKPYSTTVFIKSQIGGMINAKGWLPWDGKTDPPATIFYGEYWNVGPGSGTAGRVRWAGYRPALSDKEAQKYSVGSFVQGNQWIPSGGAAGVPFQSTV